MNYFAHAIPFLEEPYLAAGTGVPDWLSVVDRRVRLTAKHATPFRDDADHPTAAVARGVCQHLSDDARFHASRGFVEVWLELTAGVREALGEDAGFRPSFLGHLLAEVLLDASLVAEDPGRLEAYYDALARVDGSRVQQAVNTMAPRTTTRLAWMIMHFRREQILWDYLEDGKLMERLNQVMRRARCCLLPADFARFLPAARRLVEDRKAELLDGIPTTP